MARPAGFYATLRLRFFRRINLRRERTDYVRRREEILGARLCDFFAFVLLIVFGIFSVFAVVAPCWLYPSARSCDPVCKIRTRSHRSGYKHLPLARRVTNKKRTECCHELVRRSTLDAGRSRCSNRAIKIAIRRRNLMLTLDLFLN